MPQLAPTTHHFLGLQFTAMSAPQWRDLLLESPRADLRILVTPNVDHIVQLEKRTAEIAPAYAAADWNMCDSRILERLGRLRGIELQCYPGADLVHDLLHDPRLREKRVAVVGPDAADFARLTALFPQLGLIHIPAPFMAPGSAEWEATLARTEASDADITLLCISFPKQEFFARDLKARGHLQGVAICAGASLDFLTGHQHRAPMVFRRTGMEWLHRLLSQPRRLWRRYLVDGPRIFAIYLRRG